MRHKLLLLGILGTACGGDDAVPSADAAPPSLEIGSSVQGYEPLGPGGALLLYRGPQGGYHVYLGLRVSGVFPGTRGETPRVCLDAQPSTNPCVGFEVRDLDTGKPIDAFVALRLPLTVSSAASGSYELVPPRLVPINTNSFEELEGHRLRITASVDDMNGVHVEETVETVVTAVR